MNDEEAFLAAILADPEDDTVRLVFADWLDENGHHARAGFIRATGRQRLGAFLNVWQGYSQQLERATGLRCRGHGQKAGAPYLHFISPDDGTIGDVFLRFRRGFVDSVECRAGAWIAHAGDVCAAHPVRAVTLTDLEPYPAGREVPDSIPTWFRKRAVGGGVGNADFAAESASVPDPIFAHLTTADDFAEYSRQEYALNALSFACVGYGRELAGLPPLPNS